MLRLSLPKLEAIDDKTGEFKEFGGETVELEHSLYTVASWEAKWKTPFASKNGLTREQFMDYLIEHMCQTPGVPKRSWLAINQHFLLAVKEYMDDSQTATTIKRLPGHSRRSSEIVTAELLYFYMTQYNIPQSYEHWHLNRLLTLLDVCAVKSAPPKKMSAKEAAAMQAKQNAELRAKLGSRG